MEMEKYEPHEFATLFPAMTQEEYTRLCDDIGEHGLIEPITLWRGKILDGVHRWKACRACDIDPRYQNFTGSDAEALAYVWSKNAARRHHTTGQLAMLGDEIRERLQESKAGGDTTQQAAKLVGVSRPSVDRASRLKKQNPALAEKVRTGQKSLHSAMIEAGLTHPKPKADPVPEEQEPVEPVEQQESKRVWRLEITFDNGDDANAALDMMQRAYPGADITLTPPEPEPEPPKPTATPEEQSDTKSTTGHMYQDAKTWSPFKGCTFDCSYCKKSFQAQAKRQKHNCGKCGDYRPHQHPERLGEGRIPKSQIVFVCGNSDISMIPEGYMYRILSAIKDRIDKNRAKGKVQTFYLQSKSPSCMAKYLPTLKGYEKEIVCVTTLETNRDAGYSAISKATKPSIRYEQFKNLQWERKIITIEPAIAFDVDTFADWILSIKPEAIWLGYNSRTWDEDVEEPTPEEMYDLADRCIKAGIVVKGKSLRNIKMPEGTILTQGE